MNTDRSNIISLKYQRFTPAGCKEIGIRKFEFVAGKDSIPLWKELATFLQLLQIIYLL